MPDRRPIGDILAEQRRACGLSIDRVVADTKLQRRIIEAFEYSDFDAMPPKGYAQASLASYARYLGLDTTEVLRAYERQSLEYRREQEGRMRPDAGRREAGDPMTHRRPSQDMPSQGGGRRSEHNMYRDGMPSRVPARPDYPSQERPRNDYPRDDRSQQARYAYDSPRDAQPYPASAWQRRGTGAYDPNYAYTRATSSSRGRRREEGFGAAENAGAPAGYRAAETPRPARGAAGRPTPGNPSVQSGRVREPLQGRPRQSRGPVEPHRGQTQAFDMNSGYEGGSGGPAMRKGHSRQGFSDVLKGVVGSVLQDRTVALVAMGVVALILIAVIVSCVSSCIRSTDQPVPASGGAPVASVGDVSTTGGSVSSNVVDGTKLNPTVDLTALPANTVVSVSVSPETQNKPWLEVVVDGEAKYADTIAPSTYLEWTVGRGITIRLSSIEGVTVSVGANVVTPVLDGGTYVLNASVPESQWVTAQPPEGQQEPSDQQDGYTDGDGSDSW